MRLGQAIIFIRTAERLDQKAAAMQIGISASTLCRLEGGKGCDAAALVKIMTWLMSEPGQ